VLLVLVDVLLSLLPPPPPPLLLEIWLPFGSRLSPERKESIEAELTELWSLLRPNDWPVRPSNSRRRSVSLMASIDSNASRRASKCASVSALRCSRCLDSLNQRFLKPIWFSSSCCWTTLTT